MSPKKVGGKKTGGAAAATAGPAADTAGLAAPAELKAGHRETEAPADTTIVVKREHEVQVNKALDIVFDAMPGIAKECPVAWVQEAFSLEKARAALQMSGEYRAAGNFFWIDMSYSACRNIPIAMKALTDAREKFFESPQGPPRVFPFDIVVAVPNPDLDGVPASLKRVSDELSATRCSCLDYNYRWCSAAYSPRAAAYSPVAACIRHAAACSWRASRLPTAGYTAGCASWLLQPT
jgi:hypothetical protein